MQVQTLILGAGAAGMFCAIHAGGDTLVVDHAKAAGEKIRISGGGRCNFTNMEVAARNYLSANPHFAKSALARFGPWDFIDYLSRYNIAWHEKTLGQLFCDGSAKQIVAMLLSEMGKAGADLWTETEVLGIEGGDGFTVTLKRGGVVTKVKARNLVVATGGKSIPKMGATGLAYQIAAQFGLAVTETRPALVPFTFDEGRFAAISGTALPVVAKASGGPAFAEAMLFTHRGLSGPSMLQTSSYWREGEVLTVDLLPGVDVIGALKKARGDTPKRQITTALGGLMPSKVVDLLSKEMPFDGVLGSMSDSRIDEISQALHGWQIKPTATEGYRTAEVTLGGVDTNGLSSTTMEAKAVPGLYFIGEAVDVTGWLGGYNFQWAWASAHAAGKAISG